MIKPDFMDKLLEGAEVEWKPLGEISGIYGGLKGKSKVDFENGDAKYVSYKNIFDNIDVDFEKLESVKVSASENQHKVRYGDVLFTGSSETAEEAGMSSSVTIKLNDSVFLNSFSFGVRFNEDIQIIPEFSKYLFRSRLMRTEIAKTANGVTRFNISKARFKKIQTPIPPLKAQEEIVRILDTFTEFTAELTTELRAELTARKKQYTYYRDQLLTFEEGEVQLKSLKEIGEFTYGYAAKAQESGDTRFIRITDINTNGKLIPTNPKYVDTSKENERYILKKNDLLMARTGATYGKTMIFEEDYPAIFAGFLIKLSFPKKLINPKYYWHFSQSDLFWYQANKLVSDGGQPQFNANALKEVKIPIPYPDDPKRSLDEQDRIVSLLDKYDTLISSITEGLSREIELRQKQYEYYRNMLLSFPKEGV